MRMGLTSIALQFSLLVAGCASSIYEGRYAWGDGWRQGKVTAVGEGPVFAKELAKNCKVDSERPSASQRYATIRYTRMSRSSWRIVPVATDAHWKVDDLLYVNVLDCKVVLQARTQ